VCKFLSAQRHDVYSVVN
jgi:hypothetical protein